jgi:hypothetical protein
MHAVAEAREGVELSHEVHGGRLQHQGGQKESQGVHSVNMKRTKNVAKIHRVAYI